MNVKSSVPGHGPYGQFNFLVQIGVDECAGFQECSGLGGDIMVGDFRDGTDGKRARRAAGPLPAASLTLKRGLTRSKQLGQWVAEAREGALASGRTITISLQNEAHTSLVQSWRIHGARLVKHIGGPLNAKGTDVAVEELTLAYERLEIV